MIVHYKFEKKSEAETALGLNRTIRCTGLTINKYAGFAYIRPINTRGIGHTYLQIPIEDIDNVIRALKKCKEN